MIPATGTSTSQAPERPRAERRISVRLPLTVRGRDSRGVSFVEETSSENLCRGGAAFVTRFDVAVGSDLEIYIPFSQAGIRRREKEPEFTTKGKVVHVRDHQTGGEYFVGVQFTGPRFRRFFHPESAA
jgi:hypothetical protein